MVTRNYIITFYDSIGTHYICPISRTDRNVITSTRDDVYDACGHMLQSVLMRCSLKMVLLLRHVHCIMNNFVIMYITLLHMLDKA